MQLITGANGVIGSEVVKQLIGMRSSSVRLMVRDRSRLKQDIPSDWEVVEASFDEASSLDGAFKNVSAILYIGKPSQTLVDQTKTVIAKAKAYGVPRIVKISALGTSEHSKSAMNQAHNEADKIVQDAGIEAVIVRPHFFMSNFLRMARGIAKSGKISLPAGNTKIAAISVSDIARTCTILLSAHGKFSGEIFNLTGPDAHSVKNMAQIIANARGAPVEYNSLAPSKMIENLERAGFDGWSANALTDLYEDMAEFDGYVSGAVSSLGGGTPLSFEQFIHANKAAFQTGA